MPADTQKRCGIAFNTAAVIVVVTGLLIFAGDTVSAADVVYSGVGESDRGVREVYVRDGDNYYYGAIDEEGKVIVAPTSDSVYVSNRNGYIVTSGAGKMHVRPGFVLAGRSQALRADDSERLDFDRYLTYYDGSRGIAITNVNGAYKYALVDQAGSPLTDF